MRPEICKPVEFPASIEKIARIKHAGLLLCINFHIFFYWANEFTFPIDLFDRNSQHNPIQEYDQ